eukprot:563716-Amphidinium_carterae.1
MAGQQRAEHAEDDHTATSPFHAELQSYDFVATNPQSGTLQVGCWKGKQLLLQWWGAVVVCIFEFLRPAACKRGDNTSAPEWKQS